MLKERYYIYKRTLLLALVILTVCGCGNLYTGDETPIGSEGTGDNTGVDDSSGEELPVMLAFNNPNYTAQTRGAGALIPGESDYQEKLKNAVFYIYAFARKGGVDYATRRKDDKQEMCLIDGSTGTQADDRHGKEIVYSGNTSFGQWKDETDQPMYSPTQPTNAYNFFAYYVDDAAISNFRRNADGIDFDVEVDGSQDLMYAMAELTAEDKKNIESMPTEEKAIASDSWYSTYTARRNIVPVLTMKHQLANVRFNLTVNMKPNMTITVNNIGLKSIYKGKFKVAGGDASQTGASFPQSESSSDMKVLRFGEEFSSKTLPDQTDELLAALKNAALLVPPSNNSTLIIEATSSAKGDYTLTYPLKDLVKNVNSSNETLPPGFRAGWKYAINVLINGPEQISVNVETTGWEQGGDLEIDLGGFR